MISPITTIIVFLATFISTMVFIGIALYVEPADKIYKSYTLYYGRKLSYAIGGLSGLVMMLSWAWLLLQIPLYFIAN